MISNADALAEGVTDWWDYLALWTSIYDAPAFSYRRLDLGREAYETEATWRLDNGSTWYNYLNQRPVERYQAWALTFALVEQEKSA